MSEVQQPDSLEMLSGRGARLKQARKMAKLSRQEFENKYGISAGTIRSWEEGWKTGLTEKGARRIIVALMKEGIQCSIGWLLYGTGSVPRFINAEKVEETTQNELKAHLMLIEEAKCISFHTIQEEIAIFEKNHPDAITLIIQDDGMEPYFSRGDYTAGNRRYGHNIDLLIQQFCIVETQMGETLVRQLQKGSKPGHYNLACTNIQHTKLKEPYLYDVELVSAAPIIWHRKRDMLDT